MLIIPAINILHGRVVRLRQGDPARSSTYSDDPLAVARRFVATGARRLHVYDVDSLLDGGPVHLDLAARIAIVDHVPAWFIAGHRKEPTGRPVGRPTGAKDTYKRAPYRKKEPPLRVAA